SVGPVRAFLDDVLVRRHQPPFEFLVHALERGHGLPRPGWELILQRFGGPAREPVTALIDRAAGFDADSPPSLETFLSRIEGTGGEVKRELSGPQDEVRVMTVHGAKGLQAPIVILPDTTSAPKLDRSGLFFTEEGAPVWVGPKSGDTPDTAALRLDADERALREHRRLLYVALTRAQDRLIVAGAWSGVSKTGYDKHSWYALCHEGMQRLLEKGAAEKIEDPLFTSGAAMRVGDAPRRLAPPPEERTRRHLPDWLPNPAPAETATRVLSPTRLTVKAEPPVVSSFEPGRETRLSRGSLIHQLFQHLPELPEDTRRRAAASVLE